MNARPRKVARAATACALAAMTGCTALSSDPLSPPHVRHVACASRNVGHAIEEELSPEYQVWWENVKHFCRDTHSEFVDEYNRNDNWPWPYNVLATQAVRDPMAIQAENARLHLATLWDYHFDVGSGRLNTMGRKRLQDLVDQVAALGQTIHVHRAPNPDETALRIAQVRRELDRLARDDVAFDVIEARHSPSGLSGDEAQRAMKLLSNPPAKAGASSGGEQGYKGGGYNGGPQ